VAAFSRAQCCQSLGRLSNLLVNDIWGADPLTTWNTSFWEYELPKGLEMQRLAVVTHLITSWYAAPLLVRRGRELIVEVTDGVEARYRGSFFYDLAKATLIPAAVGQAEDLRPHGVAAVAVSPGFMRSEAVLDAFGVGEANPRDGIARDPHFAASETPRFLGCGIAALAADPDVLSLSGRALGSWDLARRYDLTDVDGARPDWATHFREGFSAASLRADRPQQISQCSLLRRAESAHRRVVRRHALLEALAQGDALGCELYRFHAPILHAAARDQAVGCQAIHGERHVRRTGVDARGEFAHDQWLVGFHRQQGLRLRH
jgi:NAD(P)-dependent dehydrogenase (short-subunit alcohol dehydrogenase family)